MHGQYPLALSVHLCMITTNRVQAETNAGKTSTVIKGQLQPEMTLSITRVGPSPVADGYLDLPNRRLADGPDCATGEDTDPLPPCMVRQQGLDVVGTLEGCYNAYPTARWIVLLEDDFMPCEAALQGLSATLSRLNASWITFARFSQGSGVVAFPRENVPLYAASMRVKIQEELYDRVLLAPWSVKPDFVAPTHLFRHIGAVSSIEYRNTPEYRQRYAGIRDNACGAAITV
jgi:hypothetical protein